MTNAVLNQSLDFFKHGFMVKRAIEQDVNIYWITTGSV